MVTGKARLTKVRETQRMLFDEAFIDEFQVGEAPDPAERRLIRLVRDADRLAIAPEHVLEVVEPTGVVETAIIGDSDDSACFTEIGEIEIGPMPCAVPDVQAAESAVIEDAVMSAAILEEPATPSAVVEPSVSAVVVQPADFVEEMSEADSLTFEWRSFVYWILGGAMAAVIFLDFLGGV